LSGFIDPPPVSMEATVALVTPSVSLNLSSPLPYMPLLIDQVKRKIPYAKAQRTQRENGTRMDAGERGSSTGLTEPAEKPQSRVEGSMGLPIHLLDTP
jgi:hypothetical protein